MRASGLLRHRLPARAVVAPPIDRRAPIWDGPCPIGPDTVGAPKFWLLGSHGGAGVSTLARLWPGASDCGRRWPRPMGGETPFVVLVARETVSGLASADALLRQHCAGLAGDSRVVGLVSVAARPGRTPTTIRRDLALYSGLVERSWRIGWYEPFTQRPMPALVPDIDRESDCVPGDIGRAGRELNAVIEQLAAERESTYSMIDERSL